MKEFFDLLRKSRRADQGFTLQMGKNVNWVLLSVYVTPGPVFPYVMLRVKEEADSNSGFLVGRSIKIIGHQDSFKERMPWPLVLQEDLGVSRRWK